MLALFLCLSYIVSGYPMFLIQTLANASFLDQEWVCHVLPLFFVAIKSTFGIIILDSWRNHIGNALRSVLGCYMAIPISLDDMDFVSIKSPLVANANARWLVEKRCQKARSFLFK